MRTKISLGTIYAWGSKPPMITMVKENIRDGWLMSMNAQNFNRRIAIFCFYVKKVY